MHVDAVILRLQLDEACESIARQDKTIREQLDKIVRLRAEITDARRTAKYWEAEHLAANAALIAAAEILQVDRTSLFEKSRNRATGVIDDPDDQAALDDYDRVIAQADAALGEKG